MKNLLYIFLVFGILFSSCEEETDDPFNPTSSFSCKIDGVQLSDSSPIGRIITQGTYIGGLEISGTSNLPNARVMNTLYITVKDFSNVAENDTLDLGLPADGDRKSTRLNSSHVVISYAVFCLKKKTLLYISTCLSTT